METRLLTLALVLERLLYHPLMFSLSELCIRALR